MSWLTNYVRPKIRNLVKPREVPDNFWTKCPVCGDMIVHKEVEQNLHICPKCSHHFRMTAQERLDLLFDIGYTAIELPEVRDDPLNFADMKKYSDRLKEYRKKTGRKDAMIVAHGTMGGIPTVIGVLDFSFMGGSMGMAVGEAVIAAAELAMLQESPLILVTSSGGARMQEGMLSLMQMARTTLAVKKLKEKGLPYIVLLTDPTTGGVTASFAMLSDIAVAEPKATIGFAGSRVIEQTIRESLPKGFQESEYLLEHGMIDMVVPRKNLRSELVKVISLLVNKKPAGDLVEMAAYEDRD